MATLQTNITKLQQDNIKLNVLLSKLWSRYTSGKAKLSTATNKVMANIELSTTWKNYSNIKLIMNNTTNIINTLNNISNNKGNISDQLDLLQQYYDNIDKIYIQFLQQLQTQLSKQSNLGNLYITIPQYHPLLKNIKQDINNNNKYTNINKLLDYFKQMSPTLA